VALPVTSLDWRTQHRIVAPAAAPNWLTHRGVIAIATITVVVALQLWVGAFHSERGLYSDESAHFMNGLVLRDYIRENLSQSPMTFARDYYAHYPKIAPFMWPPLFHGLLGLFLLPGWAPMPAAIFFLGVFTAWIAWRLYFIVSPFSSAPVAIGAVSLFLFTPIVIELSSAVMVDIVVAAFAFEALVWLGRFAHSESTKDAAVFGLMTACACAAKGNGLSLVFAPLALILFTGNYRLLRRPGLWVAAAIVVVIAAPPLYVAYQLDAPLGDFSPLMWSLVWSRVTFYSHYLWEQLGTVTLLLAAIGTGVALSRRTEIVYGSARHQATALVAVTTGAFVFHLVSPHTLSSGRYITLAVAPILGLAALGVMALTRIMMRRYARWSVQLITFAVIAVVQVIDHSTLAAQAPLGYRSAFKFIDASAGLANRRVLVVSDEFGEGAGVAEAAALGRYPRPIILRGSKVLASDDWMGNHFALRHQSPAELLRDLEAMQVDYVLLDESDRPRGLPYWEQTAAALTLFDGHAELVSNTPVDRKTGPLRLVNVYRLKVKAPGAPQPIDLTGTADRSLEHFRVDFRHLQ
jgi:dolichyl-phosphate-mannose-protein mannosyltransferase